MNKYKLDLGIIQDLSHKLPVITNLNDRFQHTYILGKTGMGKSVLMERMANYDIKQGISVIYIDPKGDSVKKLYHLSQDKARLKYISVDHPLVINPLNKKGYSLDIIIKEFVNIIDTLITLTSINPESSVRMKEIINMAIKSFDKSRIRIDFLAEFLSYEDVRKNYKHKFDEYQKYWKEFDAKQGQFYKNRDHHITAKSIASRLLQFVSDERIKKFVLGDNELYIDKMIENGESLLIDTSRMSKDERIFISNLIIHSVASYCEYSNTKKPLLVYVDEFQTVASDFFSEILQFGRSKQVGFVLAHHDFLQIKRELLSAIFGIIDAFVIFRSGDEEAKRVAPLFGLEVKDFVNLPKYQAWVRLGTDNTLIETSAPLTKETPEIDLPGRTVSETAALNFLRNSWIQL